MAAWARGYTSERAIKGSGSSRAGEICQRYGHNIVFVEDGVLKTHSDGAYAVTDDFFTYISDNLPGELAEIVGYHEAVHGVKRRGNASYQKFLASVGENLKVGSRALDDVMSIVVKARFGERTFFDLTRTEQRIAFDELNALVWGYYKADPENAREQFADVFIDYDGYIAALDAIMEEAEKRAGNLDS